MTDDTSLTDSDAITPTATALVLELADGRAVELTAHVATARDDGLRAIEEREVPDELQQQDDRLGTSQRVFEAGPATLVLRDFAAEDDDPIGLLPLDHLDELDVDVPDDWARLGRKTVEQKIGDPTYRNPVFEHDSREAWLIVERKFVDGDRQYRVYIEAGTPSLGIHPVEEQTVTSWDVDGLEDTVTEFLANYDHDSVIGDETRGST